MLTPGNINLTRKEARQLVTILGHYQSELESAIDSHTLQNIR